MVSQSPAKFDRSAERSLRIAKKHKGHAIAGRQSNQSVLLARCTELVQIPDHFLEFLNCSLLLFNHQPGVANYVHEKYMTNFESPLSLAFGVAMCAHVLPPESSLKLDYYRRSSSEQHCSLLPFRREVNLTVRYTSKCQHGCNWQSRTSFLRTMWFRISFERSWSAKQNQLSVGGIVKSLRQAF
jgi:hypothetical protein